MSRSGITRRSLLRSGAALGAGLAAGCSRESSAGGQGPYAGRTLRVFVYSGSWERAMRETFVPEFQARTGARVVLDPGWWDSIPKLKASPPGQPAFDLVLTDATQGCPAIREGLFRTLDLERVPSRARLSPSALDHWVHREGYGVTFPDSVMTLASRAGGVPFEPRGWGDLLRPEADGRLGMYDSFYMSLHTFACMLVAGEGRPGTAHERVQRDLAGVLDFAVRQRDRVAYWWPTSTDMALNLVQRNCALGNMHSTDMLPALRQHEELRAVVPGEDQAYVLLMWVVPADTREGDLALEAIDFLLSDPMQRAFARNGGATASLDVARAVAAEDPVWGSIYPSTPEGLAAVRYYPYDAYFADWDGIVATWDREVLRTT